MTTVLELHILNILVKRFGYTAKRAERMIKRAVNSYDVTIDKALNILVTEADGIPAIIQRNPSLKQGSMQLVKIRNYGRDPIAKGLGMSFLIAKAMNADYDGDALNVMLLLDKFMEEEAEPFKPHYNVPDTAYPYCISGNLTLLSPANDILSNYLSSSDNDGNNDTVFDKLELVEV
jgi:hypothetical protein